MKKIRKKLKKLIICRKRLGLILLFVLIFGLGITAGYLYFRQSRSENPIPIESKGEENIYMGFLSEVYDKIKENYWEEITDEQLDTLFKLGAEKLLGNHQKIKIKTREELNEDLTKILKKLEENKKKEFIVKLANIVLINLKPLGRSALYTLQDEKNLANRVQNVNPKTDLYETLGVDKNTSEEGLEDAYKTKVVELELDKSEESKKELEKTKYAYEVLSDLTQKQRYDQAGVEPTIFTELVRPNILHLYIKKMSPATLDEFKKATEKVDNINGLDSLILDLRANVGGSIDILPYLLGPFIGQNQYAYDFFHQGEYTPFKTTTGWLPSLVRYKKVVILIDNQTQSSAEVMAACFKKYNVGVLVGTATKGWGTIETVINLEHQITEDEKYSMFLVHSITLRENNQPIEGNGVEPLISMNNPNWEKQLFAYFHYDELTDAVKEVWNKNPINK